SRKRGQTHAPLARLAVAPDEGVYQLPVMWVRRANCATRKALSSSAPAGSRGGRNLPAGHDGETRGLALLGALL
ncbi:MAG TPA: hypothetical protein VK464_19905, partial [Symbiobacteriaceae bacterium]|nr:hypothetical protein [Symbiobacteriaceae bacterium]